MEALTIGDYIQIGLVIVAVIVVPRAIIKAWWPELRKLLGRLLRLPWAMLCKLFVLPAEPGGDTYVSPAAAWRGLVGMFVMSSDSAPDSSSRSGASQVRHLVPEPVPVSAEPNTADAEPVPGASGASQLDTSARDITRALTIAKLLDSGLLTNRDKAICEVFNCSKASSSRPDAPFQIALRLVERHRAKQKPEYVGDMIERVNREVAAEQH